MGATLFGDGAHGMPRLSGADPAQAPGFADVMDRMTSAFALTYGPLHTLAYANAAFRALLGDSALGAIGSPIGTDLMSRDGTPLAYLLERAFRTASPVHAQELQLHGAVTMPVACSIWRSGAANGDAERLLIELRPCTRAEITLGLQRELAERLLVSALREQQVAEEAEASRRSATFLANEGRRLGESLDENATIDAIRRTSLPYVGSWCVVDILDADHTMHRLTVIHPDPEKQAVLSELEGRWRPQIEDEYGLPAVIRDAEISAIAIDLAAALTEVSCAADVNAALQELGAGPSLIVPLKVDDRLLGAITFVAARSGRAYTPEDVKLAQELADRCAAALNRARLYGESMALRIRAESASQAKSTFLGMMSHELRTPLNAIAGYVDLLDMELRGPITEDQRKDLGRIRANQKYLTGLINDLLSLTKVDGGQTVYNTGDIIAQEVMEASRALVAPLISQRRLEYDDTTTEAVIVARGDRDKVVQIIVNLLSNAIKFTPPGGTIQVGCTANEETVVIRVCDTGIGIPADKLELIFDPFVQLDGSSTGEAGVGLGLAISRGLARAMHGDLTAECTPGDGARLTLSLPRAIAPTPHDVLQA